LRMTPWTTFGAAARYLSTGCTRTKRGYTGHPAGSFATRSPYAPAPLESVLVYLCHSQIKGSFAQTHCFDRSIAYLQSGKVKVKGMVCWPISSRIRLIIITAGHAYLQSTRVSDCSRHNERSLRPQNLYKAVDICYSMHTLFVGSLSLRCISQLSG
jgi:hypothetical protein